MKFFKKIEKLFAASAFAEAGEFDTARSIAAEDVEEPLRTGTITNVKTTKPSVGRDGRSLKSAGSKS
jgi:hypothetical protein